MNLRKATTVTNFTLLTLAVSKNFKLERFKNVFISFYTFRYPALGTALIEHLHLVGNGHAKFHVSNYNIYKEIAVLQRLSLMHSFEIGCKGVTVNNNILKIFVKSSA